MHIALLVLVLAVAPSRNPLEEKERLAPLRESQPALAVLFTEATEKLDAHDWESARAGFQKVVDGAPGFAPAHRRLCGTLRELKQYDAAEAACRRAQELSDDFDNRFALELVLLARDPAQRGPETLTWIRQEQPQLRAGSEDWADLKALECSLAFKQGRMQGHLCSREFVKGAPGLPLAHYFAIDEPASKGDLDQAREHLAKARPHLGDAKYAEISAALDEAEPVTTRWGIPFAKAVGVWLLVMAAMAIVGGVLSRLTLSAARRLATQRDRDPSSGAARRIRSFYKAIIAFGGLYYFFSLPLLTAVVIAGTGGVVLAFLALGHIPIKLLVIVGVVGIGTVIAIIRSLFVRPSDEEPGVALDLAKAPGLRKTLDEVAAKVGTRPVDRVYLTPDTEVAVFERGKLLQKLRGNGERCLLLGVGVLEGFSLRGFKSVLAHEYGHFSNQDTSGGDVALTARFSLMQMGRALAESGNAAWYNPAWLFFRAYFAVYLRITQGASRLQEVLADRHAIFNYGSEAFREGYAHVVRRSLAFDAHAQATLREVIEGQKPLANLYGFVPAKPVEPAELEKAFDEQISREPSPYDSHPSSKDRLAWAEALAVPSPVHADDADSAWTLFSDRAALETELTDVVRANVAIAHQVAIASS